MSHLYTIDKLERHAYNKINNRRPHITKKLQDNKRPVWDRK